MGMFDYIRNFETLCPNCGKTLNEFQSKDWHCTMDEIPYWFVDRFYTSCPGCRTWVEFRRKGYDFLPPFRPKEDYELIKGEENDN